jgi:CRISPR/Cas system-associated protein endoribonuclease Cas2
MRYKWHKNPTAKPSPNAIQSKCNQAIDQLSVYNKTTKLHLAVATNKAAKKLSKLPATKLVRPDMSVSVKNYTSTASVLHDWQAEQPGSGVVSPLTVYSKQTVIGVSHLLGQSQGKDQNQDQNQDQTKEQEPVSD